MIRSITGYLSIVLRKGREWKFTDRNFELTAISMSVFCNMLNSNYLVHGATQLYGLSLRHEDSTFCSFPLLPSPVSDSSMSQVFLNILQRSPSSSTLSTHFASISSVRCRTVRISVHCYAVQIS